jgi:RNA polymerase sigma-70 factor (ECF subfamily)
VTSTLTLPRTASRSRATLDFDALYRGSRDDVYAYVATLLRDRSAAEDVTALAFERAYRKVGSYKSDRGSARAWLFGIARNAALDELRRRSRTAALEQEVADPAGVAPEDALDAALRREAVRSAFATLAPRDREVIALKFHAGLDNAELAGVLGVSPSNAGTLLHRAMTKLREALDA